MEKEKIVKAILSKVYKETDISWSELSDSLGLNYSADHLRKMAYGIKFYDECMQSADKLRENDFDDMSQKINELKRTRILLSDERTYTNKKIRSLARIENFIDLLKEELNILAESKPYINNQTIEFHYGKDNNSGILLLSDIHYGSESDNQFNNYNPDVAKLRMENLVNKTKQYCELHDVKELYVIDLGDMISGHIHTTTRLENRINVVNQIVGVSELISKALYDLSQFVPTLHFGMVEGNHDRVLPLKDDNLKEDSFSLIIQELIIQRTKDINNLIIHKNDFATHMSYNIKGHKCVAVHGDKDKINNAVNGLTAITGSTPDFVFMGHVHNANEYTQNYSEVIVNGSFGGVDSYALSIRKNSKPIQKFMIMNKEGRECTYNIDVSKVL